MEEILQRLPVKSIKRFECVSKSWISIISSSYFIEAHLRLNQSLLNQQRLLLIEHEENSHTQFASFWSSNHPNEDDEDEDSAVISKCTLGLENQPGSLFTVGCCDGLVCIGFWNPKRFEAFHFYLWNPSIKKSKKLCSLLPEAVRSYRFRMYGFGYDSIADDYKLVVILHKQVHLYGFKAQSWKRIPDFPYGDFCFGPWHSDAILLNGKFHWDVDNKNHSICTFDLATESFKELKKPNLPGNYSYFKLGTIVEEKLCCILYELESFSTKRFELWTMNIYGDGESWTPLLSINVKLVHLFFPFPCVVPWSMDDKFLMFYHEENSCKLGIYYLEEDSFRPYEKLDNICGGRVRCLVPTLKWI